MRKAIVIATLVLSAIAGASVAQAGAKPFPDLPNTPAFTSRYPVIDDIAALQNRIANLEYRVNELTWLRAHDTQMRDVFRAADLRAWREARIEDHRRIVSLETSVNQVFDMCR